MKRLLALLSSTMLLTPFVASAQDWGGWRHWHHRHMNADQMGLVGLVAAAIIAVTGYLLLRRRTAR